MTMAPPRLQHWEKLASPGHVLVRQVEVLYGLFPGMWLHLAGATIILVLSVVLIGRIQVMGDHTADWLANLVSPALEVPPPPALRMPQATWPAVTGEQMAQLATPDQAAMWLKGQLANVKRGKLPDACVDAEINKPWPTDAHIACRRSADGSRVWAWGLTKIEGVYPQLQPVLVVYRKAVWTRGADPSWELRTLSTPMIPPLAGLDAIDISAVPRSVAADFSELK